MRITAAFFATAIVLNAQVPYERIVKAAAEPGNWLTYSGNYQAHRYSPLREITAATLSEDAHLYPLRDAYLFNPNFGQTQAGAAGSGPLGGNWTAPNPPFGAVLTYTLRQDLSLRTEWMCGGTSIGATPESRTRRMRDDL